MESLKGKIKFGKWDSGKDGFTYCGRNFVQKEDGSVETDMNEYVRNLTIARITRDRKKETESSLSEAEHRTLRALVGQLAWLGRMGMPEIASAVSRLAGSLAKPVMADLLMANTIVRTAKKIDLSTLKFSPKIDLRNCCVGQISDSAFDNLKKSGSQRGHIIVLANKEIIHGHKEMHTFSMIEWKSSRMRRVVRSTLAAEAYSASEASESLDYTRALLAEALDPSFTVRNWQECAARIPGVAVTDCKSLFDVIATDLPKVADRRLALECMILKGLENVTFKWVPSQQMLADALTKDVGFEILDYFSKVRRDMLLTFGPDDRAPVGRRVHQDVKDMSLAESIKAQGLNSESK